MEGPSHVSLTVKSKWWPVVERQDTLYLATINHILVSTDRGETWKVFCKSIEGRPIGMILTDGLPDANSDFSIYLAFQDAVFRTIDAGRSWIQLSKGLTDRKIRSMTSIDNTVFVGTDDGLYRYDNNKWGFISIVTLKRMLKKIQSLIW